MEIEELKSKKLIVQECLSGSRAYGLDNPDSDTDIKGVFVLEKNMLFGLGQCRQVSNPSNDIVYYELGRYIELLLANNPNIIELAATPQEHTFIRHEMMNKVKVSDFISKKASETFGGYAMSQLKRARGLNKKIVNPIEGPRKEILDFCYVSYKQGSLPVRQYLEENGWSQENCGLINIAHMKDLFGLFHSFDQNVYKGICRSEDASDVNLSSVSKDAQLVALMFFNRGAYSQHCKEYKEYQIWIESRNQNRYESTLNHGKKYDAKNLMHTFRLLEMGIEIAETGFVQVSRPNRKFLLSIKNGEYEYDELLVMAERKLAVLKKAFVSSKLPVEPDYDKANKLLVELRAEFYK